MRAGGRIALYGATLAAAFGVAFYAAGAFVPDGFVSRWEDSGSVPIQGEHPDQR